MDDVGYGNVSADISNDMWVFIERFGDHDLQYAILLSSMIGMAKVMNIDLNQVIADVAENYDHIPTPDILLEP